MGRIAESASGWDAGPDGGREEGPEGGRPGRTVAVVGGGVAGTSVILHLVRTLLGPSGGAGRGRVGTVLLIDPQPAGWGLAFGDTDPLLLCNTAVEINSLLADRPFDFVTYLRRHGWTGGEKDCVPRARMAEYCHDRFTWARERAAAHGIAVRQVRGTAALVETRGAEGPRIELADGRVVRADGVVVCTGVHRPRTPDGFAAFTAHPRYLDSPYPAARIRTLRPDSRVLVVGSHQSAVDASLLLCRDGHRTTVTSPSGLLPAVRVSLAAPVRDFPPLDRIARLDPGDPCLEERLVRCVVEAVRLLGPLPLRRQTSRAADPVRRLREETALMEEGACACAGVMVPLIEAVIALAPALPPARRTALAARFGWFTGRYATAVTAVNARRLLACFDSGALRMAPSYPSAVAFDGGAWRVAAPDGRVERFDYVVNATGYHPPVLHWDRAGSALHLGDPPPHATAVDHLEGDLRVRRAAGAAPERVWVVGVGTHVRIPFANHLRNVVRQARQVARELAGAEVAV
ncbi:FAD/NAD(P)-binding protein [Streptomyces sp. NPDC020379]|uniref:FAD/NAD(P)-binding protein n=1 Tax=Streptomyces sp. NPDC020379 TaxID=3365071 RepID=UPI0037AB4096